MNCEALAFVAAQLHAAKCVQRYKCSEIAQALNETPYFLFFLLLNSVYCTFDLCFRLSPKTYRIRLSCIRRYILRVLINLTRPKNWSTSQIGVAYGTILTLSLYAKEETATEENIRRE